MVECVCVSIKEVFRVGISNDPECVKFLAVKNDGLFGSEWDVIILSALVHLDGSPLWLSLYCNA